MSEETLASNTDVGSDDWHGDRGARDVRRTLTDVEVATRLGVSRFTVRALSMTLRHQG
jgi:hypothetical protein